VPILSATKALVRTIDLGFPAYAGGPGFRKMRVRAMIDGAEIVVIGTVISKNFPV
jgi:hypothetical protein